MNGTDSTQEHGDVEIGGTPTPLSAERTLRPRNRKAQIRENASDLFARRGFHTVRMDDVAEASGITARALYRHYSSKQAILSHVVHEDQNRLITAVDQLSLQPPGSGTTGEGQLRVLAEAALSSPRLSILWQREARHLGFGDYELVRNRTRRIASELGRLVITQVRPDLNRADVELRSWAMISVLTSSGYYETSFSRVQLVDLLVSASAAILQTPISVISTRDPEPPLRRAFSARREQLIASAARAFRRKGFAGVGIDEIGAAAGVVGPAIYRHFGSKTDVLVAVVVRYSEWLALETLRSLNSSPSDDAVINCLLDGYIRLSLEATDLLAVCTTEARYLPTEVAQRVDRIVADVMTEWVKWLCAARLDLSEQYAVVLARTAKAMVDDLVRTPRIQSSPAFRAGVSAAVSAVLFDVVPGAKRADGPGPSRT